MFIAGIIAVVLVLIGLLAYPTLHPRDKELIKYFAIFLSPIYLFFIIFLFWSLGYFKSLALVLGIGILYYLTHKNK